MGSRPTVARRAPSGLNATAYTAPPCPENVRGGATCSPSCGSFHSLIVRSTLDEARYWPSGLNATANPAPVCPVRARICLPVTASQIRTVPSLPAEATRVPSRLYVTPLTRTPAPWPSKLASSLPVVTSQTCAPGVLAEARRLLSGLHAICQ